MMQICRHLQEQSRRQRRRQRQRHLSRTHLYNSLSHADGTHHSGYLNFIFHYIFFFALSSSISFPVLHLSFSMYFYFLHFRYKLQFRNKFSIHFDFITNLTNFFSFLIFFITWHIKNIYQKAQAKRRKLLKDKPDSANRSLSNSTTYMLMVVVTVFLLVEIPMAIATIVHLLTNIGIIGFEDDSHLPAIRLTVLLCNFIIMLSFPLNFAIYCGMSAQFRNTFQAMMMSCIKFGPKNVGSRIVPVTNGEETGSADNAARGRKSIAPETNTLAIISTEMDN